jgi:light-regulated signal transduction histidine kinase (bacteriophytochrome)
VREAQSTGIDITDRKRAEEALQRANADLEQFAYSAGHDLQEPIRNISISAQILTANYSHLLDNNGRERLAFVEEGARRMGALVNDLLNYTQIANAPPEELEPISAREAFDKALLSLASVVEEAGAEIAVGELPVVRVPDVQLHQLFQNLLSNAVKYRKDGTRPRVLIRSERQAAYWLFSVQDNGIGIAPEYHERIFGLFKRLHRHADYGGTGIGLAICQRIVERQGGRIWVESAGDGAGSTFFFTLPALGG